MPLLAASRSRSALASEGGGVEYSSPVRGSQRRGSMREKPWALMLPDAGAANIGAASCRLRSITSSSSKPRVPSNLPRPASASCTSSTARRLVHTTLRVAPVRTPTSCRVAVTPSPGRLSSLPAPNTFWYAASAPVTSSTMLSRASNVWSTAMANEGILCPSYETVMRASPSPSSGLGSFLASGAAAAPCFLLGAPALPSAMEKSMGAIMAPCPPLPA
mmetsp:Transcript_13341/g.34233  ORF Transcript_13341/g.34233 Transcript_13341/m.34233 type:complete len:218 (-) Transcript_13341:65-718(-)